MIVSKSKILNTDNWIWPDGVEFAIDGAVGELAETVRSAGADVFQISQTSLGSSSLLITVVGRVRMERVMADKLRAAVENA